MPRHLGLPRPEPTVLIRQVLLSGLKSVDAEPAAQQRVLAMETGFRRKVDDHVASLPQSDSSFEAFNTSPFVLLIHARQRSYSKVSEIERDILPAKQLSSMETSAGRMVEEVVFPVYGWECVPSGMHTPYSALDGKTRAGRKLLVASLKSGPRCLNDEMSENLADAVVNNFETWASDARAKEIDFTYGVLYGTKRQSNKKDWHILRNIDEKKRSSATVPPAGRWDCEFVDGGITVRAAARIGLDWWSYLGGELCFLEVMTALIRACIAPGQADATDYPYAIEDLGAIVSTEVVPDDYNVSLLQRSQIPWLFLMARHYCDHLVD